MQFSSKVRPYLEGNEFSNSLSVRISKDKVHPWLRIDLLEKLARGKRVVHIGFADHIPVIEKKMEANQWLHKRLVNSAKECVGIDIDGESVGHIVQRYGIDNVHVLDVIEDPVPDYLMREWDLIIVAEVLEHIDNPVTYLENIHKKYKAYAKQLVITVPNALSLQNIRFAIKDIELINSDHRYWFTPFTLAKVASRAGFSVDHFSLCQYYEGGKWWQNRLLTRFALLRDNLVMVLNF